MLVKHHWRTYPYKTSHVDLTSISVLNNSEYVQLYNSVCVCGPQEFEAWVSDTAEHGFVVVSFGAGVKYLSNDIAHKLAGALARLPQRVVWR